jgi:hypothetical protein
MPIDAPLFAHIHNDAFLLGTYGLQGYQFSGTITYLSEYLTDLSKNGEYVPESYKKLEEKFKYTQKLALSLDACSLDKDVVPISNKIVQKIQSLQKDKSILIPGGWKGRSGGHAMVYEFALGPDGYIFTTYNSGAGISYHSKKSIRQKELYNPKKSWSIPMPKTDKEREELEQFIQRLLKCQVPPSSTNIKKDIDETVLYEEILPSISYLDAKEIKVKVPDHAYTGGQISGTCTQRSLHQLLKMNSSSLEEYQSFIFKFKMHSLREYKDLCLTGKQPFNYAVADQIDLAINNALKILNVSNFSEKAYQSYFDELQKIKKEVKNQAAHLKKEPQLPGVMPTPPTCIWDRELRANILDVKFESDLKKVSSIGNYEKLDLLERLDKTISDIKKEADPVAQYIHLEKLIFSLPLNTTHDSMDPAYQSLKSPKECEEFLTHMNSLQKLLFILRSYWLKEAQIPLFNHLSLSVLSLQNDAYEKLISVSNETFSHAPKLPSFRGFSDMMMATYIENHDRDPFEATNNPQADQRIRTLKTRFKNVKYYNEESLNTYFQQILETEPKLNTELIKLYQTKHDSNPSEMHTWIRKNNFQALFLVLQHLNNPKYPAFTLDTQFNLLIDKIRKQLDYEIELRRAINPLSSNQLKHSTINIELLHNQWRIISPLYTALVPFQDASISVKQNKYNLKESPALQALERDISVDSKIKVNGAIKVQTSNEIQLNTKVRVQEKKETFQKVTEEDIIARNFHHLRTEPSLQIPITLEYFQNNLEMLTDENNKRYLEANLFQPGLLFDALQDQEFVPQFNHFLTVGKRFFALDGKHTQDSLLFFRLDLLVSRYFANMNDKEGLIRLKKVQEDLLIQLPLAADWKVTYTLQQYIFLAVVARIEAGDKSEQLLGQAMRAYFYISSHANPEILEDSVHRTEVETAIGKFKIFINKQPASDLNKTVKNVLKDSGVSLTNFTGNFPLYTLVNKPDKKVEVDALQGKIFENGLAKAEVPLFIQNHPLIKQLGLEGERECLINSKGNYLRIKRTEGDVHLFFNEKELTVQKEWCINGKTQLYELQALTSAHQAYYANEKTPIAFLLPEVLTDGTMNYWKNTKDKQGLLIKNNIPAYLVRDGSKISPLNNKGFELSYQWAPLQPYESEIFQKFESDQFIIAYEDKDNKIVTLPRYGLNFKVDKKANTIIHEATGEQVVSTSKPIHPSVAGLVLEEKNQQRVIIPVARFYNAPPDKLGDFYPVIHDKYHFIPNQIVAQLGSQQKPQWNYGDSEHYASFQLVDGEPIADTPADALYLAYMYLVTDQPEKAWNVLEDCNRRLGGLKGEPDELQYIKWICKDLPYIAIPGKDAERAIKATPSVVACQLKAMSFLSDCLTQDRKFSLIKPEGSDKSANARYAKIQHEELEVFLQQLPETIYETWTNFQKIERHLKHTYHLVDEEREHLLNYYYKSLPKDNKPLGALGYEWTRLSLAALLKEEQTLIAQESTGKLSPENEKRKAHIEKEIKKLNNVAAKSTKLQLVPINLSLPAQFTLKEQALKTITSEVASQKLLNKSIDKSPAALGKALEKLSSSMEEEEFINNFSSYLYVACTGGNKLTKPLFDFCTRTLLATRHLPLSKQESNIPFLCNILYRTLTNQHLMSFDKCVDMNAVVQRVREFHISPLEVYEAKDLYKKVLATPEQIKQEYQHQKPKPIQTTDVPKASLIAQTGLENGLLAPQFSTERKACNKFIKDYQDIQQKLSDEIKALGNKPAGSLKAEFSIEEAAGKLLLNAEQQKKELANRLLDDKKLIQALDVVSTNALATLKVRRKELWDSALALANQGPAQKDLAKIWALEKEAEVRKILTEADLLSIYTKADYTYTIEKTGLTEKDAKELQDRIHLAVLHGIYYQSVEQIQNKLSEAAKDKEASTAVIALDLLARSEIPALDSPAIVLLQHEEQLLLRDRQASALKELLASSKKDQGFNEVIEKIIMGGGKSKVILPILAEMKARGNNLVIVEVPQALFETNYEDLNRTSQRLYGKRAYRFAFNRDSNTSPERLEQIYKMFVKVMTNKNYLITTGEAMMSLELKYIELLFTNGPTDKIWEEQIYWLDKITSLVRHQGDCIIDEVHLGLLIKKRLNYTASDGKPISSDTIKYVLSLYRLIDSKLIKEAATYPKDHDWTDFKNKIADKLIEGPLKQFVEESVAKYGNQIIKELKEYLTNQSQNQCLAVVNASFEDKERLAFFKQEISTVLPQTLSRRVDENYGPSKRKDLSPIEKTLALPYSANNVANERNRFGNQLESVNYTAQMMLIKGISKKVLIQKIDQWLVSARKELFDKPELNYIDATPTAKGFKILAQGLNINLSQINLNDPIQLNKLHTHFQNNQALIYELLQEQSLAKIEQEGETISANSHNHVDLYRSVQGVSGTPSNHTTFHQRLKYNKNASLGTDGYIIEVLRQKNTRISGCAYEHVTKFINDILTHSEAPERTRAIIDVCARFQGVSNFAVAQELASFYRGKKDNEIKHIVYFNKNQILCALDINKPDKPITLKTTDEKIISRKLGSTPDQRFTYYDQSHITGTDITQGRKAHAVALVDRKKTSQEEASQGCLRMRGIALEQTLEFIVPEDQKKTSFDELINQFIKTSNLTLRQENLTAAKYQMANLLRSKCLESIRNLPSEEANKKRKLAEIFKSKGLLVDKSSDSFYELYGALSKKQKTKNILKNYKEQLIACWNSCCDEATKIGIQNDKNIDSLLQDIIDKALPNCDEQYETIQSSTSSIEVELQAQMQKETQLELAQLQETFDPKLHPYSGAVYHSIQIFHHLSFSLNNMCGKKVTLFDSNLRVTTNYAEVYQGQTTHLNAFLKPVYVVLYTIDKGVLKATILTPEEARNVAALIKSEGLTDTWLSTPGGILLGGKRPEGILNHPRYQSLREQVRFFNGEISALVPQETPKIWLLENTDKKLEFFERNLMAYRPGSAKEFPRLKQALTQKSVEGFIYIAQHPYDNFKGFNWKKIEPKISEEQKAEYVQLAQAFAFINQNWNKTLSINTLQAQFTLPLNSLSYIEDHLNRVNSLVSLIAHLLSPAAGNPFLPKLTKTKFEKLLEPFLGEPLQNFVAKYGLKLDGNPQENPDVKKRWSKAEFHMLRLLRSHPLLEHSIEDDISVLMAQKATSQEELKAVLQGQRNSKKLAREIIFNPYFDESVVLALLDSSVFIEEGIWKQLQEKNRTKDELKLFVDKILTNSRADTPPSLIEFAFKEDQLSEDQLTALAQKVTQDAFFYKIFIHPSANASVRKHLFNNKAFSPERFLPYYLSDSLNNAGTFKEFLDYFKLDEFIIEKNLVLVKSSSLLLALISQDKITPNTLFEATTHPAFSIEVAQKILERAEPENDPILLTALLKSVNNECKVTKNSAEWQQCIISIGTRCKTIGAMEMFKANLDSKLNKSLQLLLFTSFEKEIVSVLDMPTLIKEANEETLQLLSDSEKTGILDEKSLLLLVKKCKNAGLIDKLLQRPELTDAVVSELISKGNLTEEQLLKTLNYSLSQETLSTLINSPNFSPKIGESILGRPDLTEHIYKILGKRLLVQWDAKPEIILEDLIDQTMQHLHLKAVKKLVAPYSLNTNLGYKILTIFGADAFDLLPFDKMVHEGSEDEFGMLVNLEKSYESKHIDVLVARVDSTAQIDSLLDRKEITGELGDTLFKKPNFSRKIKNWNWLTEKQLLEVLNTTTNHESLMCALNHKNLSKSARKNWLSELEEHQLTEFEAAAKGSKEQILASINSLKILACQHAIIGAKEPKYALASEAAFILYQKLIQETKTCFSEKHPKIKPYQETCKGAIEEAAKILGKHRGCKQKLLDILNVILAVATFHLPRKGEDWRFFKAKTSSMKTVKEATKGIDELNEVEEKTKTTPKSSGPM